MRNNDLSTNNEYRKTNLPKHAYDMEYSTQTRREFEFLKDHQIFPSYIRISEYGIKTYKYTKTPALFKFLLEYYSMVQAEKEYEKLNKDIARGDDMVDHLTMDALIEHGAPIKKATIYA